MFSKKILAAAIVIVALMSTAVVHAGDDVTPLVEKGRKASATGEYLVKIDLKGLGGM